MNRTEMVLLDVEIEAVETWPPAFLSAAAENRTLILAYHREKSRISRLCEDDIAARIDPPANPYKAEYGELVERLESVLMEHRIVGFHCTRLTPEEIADIKVRGLEILSASLVKRRLDQAHAHGHLTLEQYAYLRESGHISAALNNEHGHRTGKIWLCPNRSTLRESGGVYRLFRSWGGETMYLGHDNDANIAQAMSATGSPCIVKCAIPFSQAGQFYINYAERFLSQLISDEIEYPEPPPDFDLYTEADVPASGILKIVEFSNPEFELLTGTSTWPVHHRITRPA